MPDVIFQKFGGINLVADPQELGAEQAASLLNVALDRNGRVRTRDGYSISYDLGADATVTAIFPVSDDIVLAAFSGHSVRAIDLGSGTSLANVTLGASTLSSSFAAAGTSGGIYFTDATTTQIRRYQAGAFSSPASLAAYEGNFLAVQPLEDRLVIADANSTSKLWFSDPATPETIDVSNFIQLTPGDGEAIQGMVTFGNELYVFKQSKFFVFYGNSTDSTGGAIFNYRMVDTGVGASPAVSASSLSVAAAHETGVYFIGTDGVYRTSGGPPVKVSGLIDPVFAGMNLEIPAPFSATVSSPLSAWYNLSIARDQLFALGSGGGTAATFVLNLNTGEWTANIWPFLCVLDGSLLGDATNFRGSLVMGGQAPGDQDGFIAKSNRSIATDDSAAITWHHQSGFYDLGSPNSKRVGPLSLWGSGTVTASVFTDYATSDANAGSVTLGTAPAVLRARHLKTYRGRLLSHKLSGSGPAVVHQAALTVRDQRVL